MYVRKSKYFHFFLTINWISLGCGQNVTLWARPLRLREGIFTIFRHFLDRTTNQFAEKTNRLINRENNRWVQPFILACSGSLPLEWEQWRSSAACGSHRITASDFFYWYGTTPAFKHVLIAQHELRGSLYFFFFTEVLLRREGHFSIFPPPTTSIPLHLCRSARWVVFMTADGDCIRLWRGSNKRDCNFFSFLLKLVIIVLEWHQPLQLGWKTIRCGMEEKKNVWADGWVGGNRGIRPVTTSSVTSSQTVY